ncbi:MAG: hypothetical protein H6577_28300 [Lewinellaceae bacterium]|nr:hypothetical protein [Saprospiraceae bacterium]MCB9342049.1 hypothetical protein [Lewinellaceae bacterium]
MFQKFRYTYPTLPTVGLDVIKKEKIKLTTDIGSAESIRDFGGLWGVFGLYLIEGAKGLKCKFAQMVDVTPRPEFDEKIAEARKIVPTEYNMFKADFRVPSSFGYLDKVDVSLLYEVILHQDNHVEVIKNVISKTNKCVCFAQPVMKEEMFQLPGGCTLLQFFPEELKDKIRYATWWEKEPVVERFDTRFWMWGQSISYISSIFKGYGWEMSYQKVYEMTEHWDYALLRFSPIQTV